MSPAGGARYPTAPGCYPDEMCCQTGSTANPAASCISRRMGCYPQTPPEEGWVWNKEPLWVDWNMNVASTYVCVCVCMCVCVCVRVCVWTHIYSYIIFKCTS